MKTRMVVSLLGALGALLLSRIPSEGLPQAGHPAAAAAPARHARVSASSSLRAPSKP